MSDEKENTESEAIAPSVEVKKGKPTWRPARRLEVTGKRKDFRYRWLNSSDEANMEAKQREGWQVLSKLTSDDSVHADGTTAPTSLTRYRELTLARMPEEVALARNAYFQGQADDQIKAIKRDFDRDLARTSGTPAQKYGKIVIE